MKEITADESYPIVETQIITENEPPEVYHYLPDVDPVLGRDLYRRCIMQHIEDLFKPQNKTDYTIAKDWIFNHGAYTYQLSFEVACDFADWQPKRIQTLANYVLDGKLSKKEYDRLTTAQDEHTE